MSQEDCKQDCCESKSPHEIFDKINEKPVFSQNAYAQAFLTSATLDVASQLCKMNKKFDALLEEVIYMNKTLHHIEKRLCGEDQRCRDEPSRSRDEPSRCRD